MSHTLTKRIEVPHVSKFGIELDLYKTFGDCNIVLVETEVGHNQEFYHTKSTFHYIVLEGEGTFFLDDEAVHVSSGDCLSVSPNTRIYYKGKLKMVLITNPPWEEAGEVEMRAQIW